MAGPFFGFEVTKIVTLQKEAKGSRVHVRATLGAKIFAVFQLRRALHSSPSRPRRRWGWVLAGLNARKAQSLTTALDRITADVQRLRELVAW